ncbi:MAG: extracellular solute-binding protein [Anaerolineae bacterium]|nr:extracellular solute-binding protein [Anaerolineae bacterium]
MKHRNLFALLLLALLAVGSFTSVFAQDTLEPVTITIWSQEDPLFEETLQSLFATWAETVAPGSTLELVHKDTETQRNDLLAAGLAGQGLPDIILGPNDPIGVYEDAGLVQPLDELFDISLYPYNIGAAQVSGATFGVPLTAGNHLMLMYNKSLVATPPDTWDELYEIAAQVEADNEGVQGFAYNLNEPFWFLPFVHGFGGSVFDEDGNFTMDTEAWVNAYQFVHDLKFVQEVVPTECDYGCADGGFKEGTTAMILNGVWALGDYLNVEASPALGPDNLGLAPWPALPNGERPKPFTSGKFLSIPVTVEGAQLDAVVSLVTWLTTDVDAVQTISIGTNNLPAIEAVTVDAEKDPILADAAAILETGIGMPADANLRCMWDAVRPNLEGVMADSITAADAAAEAQFAAEDACA